MNPLIDISVIVPVYNAEKYLRKCIESILAQTFTNFELLLINDGSKDNSGAICDEYAEKDSRIRVFHKENGGVSSARNKGVLQSNGTYLAFSDADDWWEINHLAELMTLAKAFPEAGLLGTGYIMHFKDYSKIVLAKDKNVLEFGLLERYFKSSKAIPLMYTSSIAVSRQAWDSTMSFPEGILNGEDLSLWAEIAYKFPVAYKKIATVNYNCNVLTQATRTIKMHNPFFVRILGELLAINDKYLYQRDLQKYAEYWALRCLRNIIFQNSLSKDDLKYYVSETNLRIWTNNIIVKIHSRACFYVFLKWWYVKWRSIRSLISRFFRLIVGY